MLKTLEKIDKAIKLGTIWETLWCIGVITVGVGIVSGSIKSITKTWSE